MNRARIIRFISTILVCIALFSIPVVSFAGSTESIRAEVGYSTTLRAGSPSTGTAYAWAWTTSDYNVVRIVGDTGSPSCRIEVTGYNSSTVIVQCLIYTQSLVGSRMVLGQDYKDYYFTISKPSYTVTLNAQGGSVSPSTLTVSYGSTYGSLPTPSRSGYTFNGWYTANGTRVTSSSKIVSNANHTLYAEWTENAYTVKFDGNGSTGGSMSSMYCKTGSSYTLSANGYSRTGCTFNCWNTKADGSGTDYSNRASIKDLAGAGGSITLYAIWDSNNKQIPQCDVSIGTSSYSYDGKAKTPDVSVRDGHYALVQGTDYTVSYNNNINAGTASVTITGTGGYSSGKTLYYTINKANQTLTANIDAEYVNVGSSVQIQASGVGAITYTANNSYAAVNAQGVVTGVSKGTASITVSAAGNQNYNSAAKTITIDVETNYGAEIAGPDITWTLSNGVLRLDGSGNMFDWPRSERIFGTCDAPWQANAAEITSVIISNRITGIGKNAFKNCTGLESVTIPNSVQTIGLGAFSGCSGLQSMTLPFVGNSRSSTGTEGLLGYIFGTSAYTGAKSITQYYNSSSVTRYIPEGLTSISVTDAETLPYGAFSNCSMLTDVDISSSGLTSIGARAFYQCTGLKILPLQEGMKTIGANAFYGCTGVKNARIPASITTIGSNAFTNCSGLTAVYIEDLKSWCEISFDGGTTNPLYYAHNLYVNGSSVTDLSIPNGTEHIGKYAFINLDGLRTVTVPNSVMSIGSGAFSGCSGIQGMILPFVGNSRSSTGSAGLFGYIFGTSAYTGGTSVTQYCSSSNAANCIPSGLQSVLISDETVLPYGAFSNCKMLSSIILPNGLTKIGEKSFYQCTGLQSLPIGDHVSTIEASAFYGCKGADSVHIPDSVTSIGSSAFEECSGLCAVDIDDIESWLGITFSTVYSNPLMYAKKLYVAGNAVSAIDIPESVTAIKDYAFAGLTGIMNLEIPSHVLSIGTGAFRGWENLTTLTVPFIGSGENASGASSVLGHIFGYHTSNSTGKTFQKYNSSDGYYYYIPESLRTVTVTGGENLPYGAFYGCKMITGINLSDSIVTIGDSAFYGCSGIKSFPATASVVSIGDNAFYNCTGLTDLSLSDNLVSIGSSAFYSCTGLKKISIPSGVKTIGESAFGGCSNIAGVYITDLSAWCTIDFANSTANPMYKSGKLYCNGTLLKVLTIPSDVNHVGDYAFYNDTSLTSLTINSELSRVGKYAFYGCSGITKFNFTAPIGSFDEYSFYGCSKVTGIVIPDGTTAIKSHAFEGCSIVTQITVPNSVKNIYNWAFHGCNKLTTITLPYVGKTFGTIFGYEQSNTTGTTLQYSNERQNPQHRTYAYIPSTLRTVNITDDTDLSYGAFYNCTMIKNIKITAPIDSFGKDCFYGCTLTVTVPSCMDTSLAQQYGGKKITWKYFNAISILDAEIQTIADQTYHYPTVEPEVVVRYENSTLKKGTDYTTEFRNNKGIGTATVTVRGVGKYVGKITSKYTIIPKSLNTAVISDIPDQQFQGAPVSFDFTVISDDVTLVPETDYAVEYLNESDGSAAVLITGKGNYTDSTRKFYHIVYSNTLRIPDAVSNIAPESFANSACEYVIIPDQCSSIGSRAFSDCLKLYRIWIPGSVTRIDSTAFSGCSKDLVIIAPIGSYAHDFAIANEFGYEEAVQSLQQNETTNS